MDYYVLEGINPQSNSGMISEIVLSVSCCCQNGKTLLTKKIQICEGNVISS